MNLPLIGNHTGDGSGDDGAMEAKDLAASRQVHRPSSP